MHLVRPATAADLDALLALVRDFYAESPYPFDAVSARDSFATLLAAPARGRVWLALDEHSAAIGHVVLALNHSMEYGGLAAIIDDLYVRPQARRRGVARALLYALFAQCRALGCRAVKVEVGAANAPARALYARYGLRLPDDDRVLLTAQLTAAQSRSS